MNCIVTGSAGFIGSHLTDYLLAKGHEVLGIDNFASGNKENLKKAFANSNFKFKEIDVSDLQQLGDISGEFDFLFHLAALAEIVPSIQNPKGYFDANVNGTFNICEQARRLHVKKIVYAASSSCYGIPTIYPTSEDAALNPQYPYALTKSLGEQIVMHWNRVYSVPAISLRLFNVYGERARTSGNYGAVMGVFLAQKLANKPLTIVSDGKQKRDFTFVDDVVRAFYLSAFSELSGKIYNVGSGNPRRVIELAKMISDQEFFFLPKRPGEPEVTFADISSIRRDLGWEPEFSLEEGLIRVLESSSDWKNAPVWTPEKIARATEDWFKYLGEKIE